MAQVSGQPSIGRMTKAPIQGCFQPPGGHSQTRRGNLTLLVAIAQPESLLQQLLDRQRELGSYRGGARDHLAATADQVFQAALMKGLLKSIEATGFVMHQKSIVILPQKCRRLGIATMRFRHVHGYPFAQS